MNKHWLMVIFAAAFEVMWVSGLKHASNWLEWSVTVISILISFGVLVYSGKFLPASTVYAIFVGLGTAGTVIMEMMWFNVPFSWAKVGLIALLLVGIIGLKTVTHSPKQSHKERGELS